MRSKEEIQTEINRLKHKIKMDDWKVQTDELLQRVTALRGRIITLLWVLEDPEVKE